MSDNSKIEWTDATWNPVTGCTKVSPGCDHCYALTLAERFRGTPGHYFEHGFDVQLRPDKLDQPLRWKKPRRIFVNSMSDLFHQDIPDEYIAKVFAIMALAPQHTFQVLTKRHGRMRSLLNQGEFWASVGSEVDRRYDAGQGEHPGWYSDGHGGGTNVLENVWLGVSVENQQWADIRIPALLDTPAAVRFLSCEPLLGPVDLALTAPCPACLGLGGWPCNVDGHHYTKRRAVEWVIVGGESGRGARQMQPGWVRSLRGQCVDAGVAFHFKQWGTFAGTPKSSRELDGRTWDEFPEVVA